MVDYFLHYNSVLTRAVGVCNQLVALFIAEQGAENKRLADAAAETRTVRDGILRRLATPEYLAPNAFGSSNISDFTAFHDNHAWNDYGGALTTGKLAERDRLLVSWIQDVVEPLVQLMNQLDAQPV